MTRDEVIAKGYWYYCFSCSRVYKTKPTQQYEDGHGGRGLELCRCGCDLFGTLAAEAAGGE